MGLQKELKLHGDEFSNTATSFFIAYLIAEIPNGTPHADELRSAPNLLIDRNYPSESPSCEMARGKRGPMGDRNRMHCSCTRLPLSSSREDLSGRF